jgi:hypothetical protein
MPPPNIVFPISRIVETAVMLISPSKNPLLTKQNISAELTSQDEYDPLEYLIPALQLNLSGRKGYIFDPLYILLSHL